MSKWRRLALEKLPLCKDLIKEVESPMMMWIELHMRLEKAYDADPPEEPVIRQIFEYASWCLRHSVNSKSYDMTSDVILAFYEHLPTNEKIRRDMRYRISREDFMYVGPAWNYFLDEQDGDKLKKQFFSPKDKRRKPK